MARRLPVRITGIDWRDPAMVLDNGAWSRERTILRNLFHEARVAIWGEWVREFFPQMLPDKRIAYPFFQQLEYVADLNCERLSRLKTPRDMYHAHD